VNHHDPRVKELERLKWALDAVARQLDELEARLASRSAVAGADSAPRVSVDHVENAFANQIVFAMNRFHAIDRC